MNRNKFFLLNLLAVSAYAPTICMNDGDPLWDENKMVAISPKPSPNKYFALHDLIQSPDTHSANTSELLDKVERLLRIYPRYLTITNKQDQTAYDLLIAQLQSTNLTTLARSNFESLKAFLESCRQ